MERANTSIGAILLGAALSICLFWIIRGMLLFLF
jgi:hypothetical protein